MTERLYQLIGQQALRIAELEAELARLNGTEKPVAGKGGSGVHHETAVHGENVSYAQLVTQHAELQLQHSRCDERLANANRRYAQAKDKVMEWHAYVHRRSSKKRAHDFVVHEDTMQHQAEDPGSSNATRALVSVADRILNNEELPLTPVSELRAERTYVNDENVPPPPGNLLISSNLHKTSDRAVQFGSSQSTVLEPDTHISSDDKIDDQAIHDDDDTITFTHSKTKRRRVTKSEVVWIKNEPGTPQQPLILSSDDRKDSVIHRSIKKRSELADLDGLQHPTPDKSIAAQQSRHTPPLRLLALEDMKLNFFKPNPNFEGPYLRFVDPNIDMTKRRCPPGCERPECCGNKMRKMIELGGLQVTAKTDPEVLQEYLGPEWRALMTSYGAARRKEVILQAHANSFASTTHTRKRRTDRPTTPPGFWRMDMISTQEVKEENVRVEEMERRTIEERWHEARRANGRWLFRDES